MIDAINAESGTIHDINTVAINLEGHNGCVVAMLTLLFEDFISFFNVGKNMGALQVKQTIDLIFSDHVFINLKPEDFKVYFDLFKKGRYGQVFDRIDGQLILMNLSAYAQERMNLVESINNGSSYSLVKDEKNIIDKMHPKIIETLKMAIKDVSDIKHTISARQEIKKSPRDILIQKLFSEFDVLCRSGDHDRFVTIDGRNFDETEYVEYKLAYIERNEYKEPKHGANEKEG